MTITNYKITSDWNEIDSMHPVNGHTGIDLATPLGTPIISKDSGIIELRTDNWLGNNIRLKMPDGQTVVYGHISEFKVVNGQHVEKNQLLGLTGGDPNMPNQGHTNGCHVHVSLINSSGQIISPYNYLFNHDNYTQNTASTNIIFFPIILLLISFIFIYKFKKLFKLFLYGIAMCAMVLLIFISS